MARSFLSRGVVISCLGWVALLVCVGPMVYHAYLECERQNDNLKYEDEIRGNTVQELRAQASA